MECVNDAEDVFCKKSGNASHTVSLWDRPKVQSCYNTPFPISVPMPVLSCLRSHASHCFWICRLPAASDGEGRMRCVRILRRTALALAVAGEAVTRLPAGCAIRARPSLPATSPFGPPGGWGRDMLRGPSQLELRWLREPIAEGYDSL